MNYVAKIIKYDEVSGSLLVAPKEEINRELLQKQVNDIEIRLNDGRTISADQRRKIFAIIADIAKYSGDAPDYISQILTWYFCTEFNVDFFSLSDVDMTTAREFITYLIEFCFDWNVPTRDTLLHQTDDIGRYLYLCLEHRKCAVCNAKAEIHHVDRVGMGRDREKIVHIGLKAIALCPKCHRLAHSDEKTFFEENHIYGIKLDKYLCDVLNLNTKNRKE